MAAARAVRHATGFVHFGQGKWYPGRTVAAVGALLLLAARMASRSWQRSVRSSPTSVVPTAAAPRMRERFCARWRRVSVSPTSTCEAAYEDVWYYLWRERRLPVNVDPFDARLDDEMERDRLRRVFSQQLDSVVGYALPLGRTADGRLADRSAASCATSACT